MPPKRSAPQFVHGSEVAALCAGVESPDYCPLVPEAGSNPTDAADTLSLPAPHTAFQDVILAKVIGKLDTTGLAREIADQVAAKVAGQVRTDTLVDTIMRREEQALSQLIVEHVLDHAAERCTTDVAVQGVLN